MLTGIISGKQLRRALLAATVLCVALGAALGAAQAQTTVPQPPASGDPKLLARNADGVPPSISLSPAVVMAKGSFGQGLTQTLTMTNQTSNEMAFQLEAEDVVIKDGKRVFVTAGEVEHSIAVTAVFSQKMIVVKPFSSGSVDIRLTLPPQTDIRAVVAMFRGTDRLQTSPNSVGMTASLGALLTFNLTENIKVDPDPVQVKPATESANLAISQWIRNSGTEPVLVDGMAVVLNDKGGLVGKMPFNQQRLLPGERLEFTAEYTGQLQSGTYKALCSYQYEGKTLTTDAGFKVP